MQKANTILILNVISGKIALYSRMAPEKNSSNFSNKTVNIKVLA